MKKLGPAVLLLSLLFAMALVAAETSQESAGNVCKAYSSEGETIEISEASCEGSYWICNFKYYGNDQNIVVALSKSTDSAIDPKNDVLPDVLATKFAFDEGSSALFGTILTDSQFAIEMSGMNTTLQNYFSVVGTLRDDGYLDKPTFTQLKADIIDLQEKSANLSRMSVSLRNLSAQFLRNPDCITLIDFRDGMNRTLSLAENFSKSWAGFTAAYNAMAGGIEEITVQSINPSNSQLLQQKIASIGPGLKTYDLEALDYVSKVLKNMETRFEKKETQDYLNEAYDTIKKSNNPDAVEKYNDAVDSFSKGDYSLAKRQAMEALAMPSISTGDGGNTQVIVQRAPDYIPYLIAVGVLLAAIFFLTMIRRGSNGGRSADDDYDEDEPDLIRDKKPKKKGSWAWTKEKESSMEKSASKGSLEP